MAIAKIDDHFAKSPQIAATHLPAIAAEGYKGVLCARPDNEDPGQPSFAEIEAAATAAGLKAIHIPVTGPLSENQVARMRAFRAEVDGPILGYCRSGGRAGTLYAAAQ
jgi:uncharacterized protein (TIGR01244 family)